MESSGKVMGQSGVTIGTGFDLGQHSFIDLIHMDIPSEIINKLKPYLELKRNDAVEFLKKNPLILSEKEVRLIDVKVKNKKAAILEREYNKDSKVPFKDLTSEQQTILASVAFQYGNLENRTPNFWNLVTTQQWDKVPKHLRNFGDAYKTRRNKEADYLEKKGNL